MTIQPEHLTGQDVADAVAYVEAHLRDDRVAMDVLQRHGDLLGLHTATAALLAGVLLYISGGDPDRAATMVRVLAGTRVNDEPDTGEDGQ